MKVLDLQCARQHFFEGWFASEDDFQSQLTRGLVACPMCTDKGIQKMPSAPRLNLGGHGEANAGTQHGCQQSIAPTGQFTPEPRHDPSVTGSGAATESQIGTSLSEQAAFLKALRRVIANTEDVGDKFAHEARAMHYGDTEARSIRGRASAREAIALLQEGIDVLPLPEQLKETLQ